jgi:hypothetical protein
VNLKSDQLCEWYATTYENSLLRLGGVKQKKESLIATIRWDETCNKILDKLIQANDQIQQFLLDRTEHSKRFNSCLVYFDTNVDFGNVCFSNFKEIYLGNECVKILKEQPICTTKDNGLLYTRPINEKKILMKCKQDGTKLMQRLKDNALKSL